MTSLVAGGNTLLFVSHNQVAVRKLCSRDISLAGSLVMDGPTDLVLQRYNTDVERRHNETDEAAIYLVNEQRLTQRLAVIGLTSVRDN